MTHKQTIIKYLEGKEEVTLTDLYTNLTIPKHIIRATLNISVRDNKEIVRVRKGVYKLKEKNEK